jgi:predicted NUDIX family NTP pyrophosphohydrolase
MTPPSSRRSRTSAGIVLYRQASGLEVFLVHPGGPLWVHRDEGAWSIPKGEYSADEEPLQAAQREFREETGYELQGPYTALSPVRQAGGKSIVAWAARGDVDPAQLHCNTFRLEWPPHSGVWQDYPEVDRGAWFALVPARSRILSGQRPLLDELERILGRSGALDTSQN